MFGASKQQDPSGGQAQQAPGQAQQAPGQAQQAPGQSPQAPGQAQQAPGQAQGQGSPGQQAGQQQQAGNVSHPYEPPSNLSPAASAAVAAARDQGANAQGSQPAMANAGSPGGSVSGAASGTSPSRPNPVATIDGGPAGGSPGKNVKFQDGTGGSPGAVAGSGQSPIVLSSAANGGDIEAQNGAVCSTDDRLGVLFKVLFGILTTVIVFIVLCFLISVLFLSVNGK